MRPRRQSSLRDPCGRLFEKRNNWGYSFQTSLFFRICQDSAPTFPLAALTALSESTSESKPVQIGSRSGSLFHMCFLPQHPRSGLHEINYKIRGAFVRPKIGERSSLFKEDGQITFCRATSAAGSTNCTVLEAPRAPSNVGSDLKLTLIATLW